MKVIHTRAIPTHIISGFLGAGKTTVLQNLLKQKPEHETWAILMNEFGQIGIDQRLLPHEHGYAIKELLGGCLCCSSQLPMHIALSRLLTDTKPDRLFIEPTGLGHPAQLIQQLTEPHWASSIHMRALVAVLDGSRLHDVAWVNQDLLKQQLQAAEIILVSHSDQMNEADKSALKDLKEDQENFQKCWLTPEYGAVSLAQIDQQHHMRERKIQPLLKLQQRQHVDQQVIVEEVKQLPYHYVEHAQGYTVAGWRFPRRWVFDFDALLDALYELKNWLRLKAIFNTDQGWIYLNCNPQQFNYKSGNENIDNRIEIISQVEQPWFELEAALLESKVEL